MLQSSIDYCQPKWTFSWETGSSGSGNQDLGFTPVSGTAWLSDPSMSVHLAPTSSWFPSLPFSLVSSTRKCPWDGVFPSTLQVYSCSDSLLMGDHTSPFFYSSPKIIIGIPHFAIKSKLYCVGFWMCSFSFHFLLLTLLLTLWANKP